MSSARRNWLPVAAVAAVFSFLVLAAMLRLHAHGLGENPLDSAEWLALKAELAERPGDEALAERLRGLDLELRRAYFSRRERIRIGGSLLLAGLIVALVAVKRANRRSRPEPDAPAAPPPPAVQDRRAARARAAVAVVGLLFVAGAAWLWLGTPSGLPRAGAGEPPPPGAVEPDPPTLAEMAGEWPCFRGHDGSGVAPAAGVPLAWDGTTGENIAWKTALPLPGTNSPVVWGDRIFLTGADARREEVYCIDAETGAMLWQKALVVAGRRTEASEPLEDTGYAAPTAATDGRRVYAVFASGRAAAFDLEGRQVWIRSFGPLDNHYGHSSSLALWRGRVILQLDQGYSDDPEARLLALNGVTGKTVWETPRTVDSSWASPVVVHPPSGPQVLVSASPIAAAYDPADGAELWRAEVIWGEVAPTPVLGGGLAFFAQEDVGLHAVRTDGRGDVTETHVAWSVGHGAPDVTSPVTDGERVWMVTTRGTLTCLRAATGEVIYEEELGAEFYSSPSLAGDVLLLTDMEGVTRTVEAGDGFRETGRNPLGERVSASMAFGPGRIYLRGEQHLFAIGER